MRILVINLGLLCFCFLNNAYATSDEWTQRWKSSSARSNENLVQANLIELKESDYYSGLGRTTIYSTSTTSIRYRKYTHQQYQCRRFRQQHRYFE